MKLYVCLLALLLTMPVFLAQETTCSDPALERKIDNIDLQMRIMESNLGARIDMEQNQTINAIDKRMDLDAAQRKSETDRLVTYLTDLVKAETNPIKMIVPVALTLGAEMSLFIFLKLVGAF